MINYRQINWLIISCTLVSGLYSLPSLLINKTGKDIWLTMLFSTVLTCLFILQILYVNYKFPKLALFEIHPLLWGRIGGKMLNIVYCGLLFFILIAVVYGGADVATLLFVYNPIHPLVLMTLGLTLAIYITTGGVQVLGRVNIFISCPF